MIIWVDQEAEAAGIAVEAHVQAEAAVPVRIREAEVHIAVQEAEVHSAVQTGEDRAEDLAVERDIIHRLQCMDRQEVPDMVQDHQDRRECQDIHLMAEAIGEAAVVPVFLYGLYFFLS